MFKRFAVFLLFAAVAGFACAKASAPQQWVEGKNYIAIASPQPTHHPGKVVVTEVFSFACPVCNRFQPSMDELKAKLPKDVVLEHVPAGWSASEDWPVFQRAYFTAKALGIDAKSHDAVFHAIWSAGGSLNTYDLKHGRPKPASELPTIEDVAKFYSQYGVKPATFVATSKSFAINTDIKRADKQILRWGVTGTPTIIVNGKWRADMRTAGGAKGLVDLTLYLVDKELAAEQGK